MKVHPSEITPEHVYLSRRKFMVGMGALVSSSLLLGACGPLLSPRRPELVEGSKEGQEPSPEGPTAEPSPDGSVFSTLRATTDELGDPLTSFEAITNYTNYYEFTTSKEGVARLAQGFKTSPWTVEVGGLVHKPKSFDRDDLLRYAQEERIYRLRCVEAWSMVIPWVGFPLAELLQEVEPMSKARYVRFETLYDPDQMPGQKRGGYN